MRKGGLPQDQIKGPLEFVNLLYQFTKKYHIGTTIGLPRPLRADVVVQFGLYKE